MACATLPADIQGCLNIELIRWDSKTVHLQFWSDDQFTAPIDLSDYEILMGIRMGNGSCVIKEFNKPVETSGNVMLIHFTPDDKIFSVNQDEWSYDIAFTKGGETKHWIKGNIKVIKSVTKV